MKRGVTPFITAALIALLLPAAIVAGGFQLNEHGARAMAQAGAFCYLLHALRLGDMAQGAQQALAPAGFIGLFQRSSQVFIGKSRIFAEQFDDGFVMGAGCLSHRAFLLFQSFR